MRTAKLAVPFSRKSLLVQDRANVLNSSWFSFSATDAKGFRNFYCTFSDTHAHTRTHAATHTLLTFHVRLGFIRLLACGGLCLLALAPGGGRLLGCFLLQHRPVECVVVLVVQCPGKAPEYNLFQHLLCFAVQILSCIQNTIRQYTRDPRTETLLHCSYVHANGYLP